MRGVIAINLRLDDPRNPFRAYTPPGRVPRLVSGSAIMCRSIRGKARQRGKGQRENIARDESLALEASRSFHPGLFRVCHPNEAFGLPKENFPASSSPHPFAKRP
jgi:hypothetical protein